MYENFYSEDQVYSNALDFFNSDELAAKVWMKKYALKSRENEGYFLEQHPRETIERVAKEIYRIEQKYDNGLTYNEVYETLKDFKYFIFGGSILYGLGNEDYISSLGNCFFIDNGADSYGGILNIDEALVQLMKRRGGVGVTLEHLRPAKTTVNNSAQTSTGIIPFAERYSNSTREVAQDGRRGALLETLEVTHPDIYDFVKSKEELNKITGANISVKLTDEFMKAVKNDQDFILRWPTHKKIKLTDIQINYNKIHKLEDGSYIKKIKARDLWNKIVFYAHKTAEPGILFWDTVLNESPADVYSEEGFKSLGCNPCGEVVLSPFGTCRLGSINVLEFVKDPYTDKAKIDWKLLGKMTRRAQRFMDNIVDLEEEKIYKILEKIDNDPEDEEIKRTERKTWEKILKSLKKGRRTGLGILALGDTLAALGYTYGTTTATKLSEEIMKFIAINSYKESVQLAKDRGAFPICDPQRETNNPFLSRIIGNNFKNKEYQDYLKYGRRNIANLSLAPTGSISILTRTTSGIEPVFMTAYKRRRKVNPNEEGVEVHFTDQNGDAWEEYTVVHPQFVKWYKTRNNFEKEEDAIKKLQSTSENELQEIVSNSPWKNSESHQINYEEKIRMQGRIQKWVDHSISVCLAKDTLIDTDEGLFYLDELTDFSKINDNEFKNNEHFSGKVLTHKNKRKNIKSFYNNGKKPVGKIKLKNGLSLKSTLNEKYLKLNEETNQVEWAMLSELEIGDRIMIKKQNDH